MTEAKRKAEELIEKYQQFAHANSLRESDLFYKELKKNAIDCALICVEEIIDQLDCRRYDMYTKDREFWQEVRDELNKMK